MKFPLLFLALATTPALAGTNGLDHRFGSGGAVVATVSPLSGVIARPYAIAIQPDGKIVLGGRIQDAAPSLADRPFVGRLNADGSWDISFGDNGVYRLALTGTAAPRGGQINRVAITSDGHILAAGGIFSGSSYPQFSTCILLMKTDADGVLDSSFVGGGDTCFNFSPEATRVGSFEAILVDASDGFYLTAPASGPQGAVAHFDKNGALIASYGSGGLAALPLNVYADVLVAAGADVIAVGTRYESGSYENAAAVRVMSDGSVDMSYGQSGVLLVDSPHAVIDAPDATLDPGGRLVIVTNDDFAGDYQPYRFFAGDAQGSLDATFNPSGEQPGSPGNANLVITAADNIDRVDRVRALSDGRLVAFGEALEPNTTSNSDVAIIRLNADSSFDTAFGDSTHPGWTSINIGAAGTNNFVRDIAADADGKIYVLSVSTCPAILRVIPDTLSMDGFDDESLPGTCPE